MIYVSSGCWLCTKYRYLAPKKFNDQNTLVSFAILGAAYTWLDPIPCELDLLKTHWMVSVTEMVTPTG